MHQLICTFLSQVFFAKHKNSYIKDLLLFNTSQFSNFCHRITTDKRNIYYNYVFEDDKEKEMTEEQFFDDISERNDQLMNRITDNLDKSVFFYLPMLIKAIFQVEKPNDKRLLAKFYERIKQRFYEINRQINQIYQSFTNHNLDFGFSLPKTKSSIASPSLLPNLS